MYTTSKLYPALKNKKKKKSKIVFQFHISTLLVLSITQIWDFIFEQKLTKNILQHVTQLHSISMGFGNTILDCI